MSGKRPRDYDLPLESIGNWDPSRAAAIRKMIWLGCSDRLIRREIDAATRDIRIWGCPVRWVERFS